MSLGNGPPTRRNHQAGKADHQQQDEEKKDSHEAILIGSMCAKSASWPAQDAAVAGTGGEFVVGKE